MSDKAFWQTKIAAFIHDPASKALILMRGMGHEKGSVAELRKEIFGGEDSLLQELAARDSLVKKADQWASAADRPSLPSSLRARVNFVKQPVLIHPLTGQKLELGSLEGPEEMGAPIVEALNFHHFERFIVKSDEGIDWRRTFLAFWRFGSQPPAPDLGLLWQELPADTRSPDHSIWDHVGLTSAIAGAMQAGGQDGIALLTMSFGPVQGFIAQARSTSDLWAGSHLLSTMVWQGMKVICQRYGPDAILFPALKGIPFVDAWLRNEEGLSQIWPEGLPYPTGASDANPLFVAALPNRFVAVVPATDGESLAKDVEAQVRTWVSEQMDEVLKELGLDQEDYPRRQIERQLESFPEVNWSLVPWDLAEGKDGKLNDEALVSALNIMGHSGQYLSSEMKGLVTKEVTVDGAPFFSPNPAVAYPGLFELGERLHAASKSVRPFSGEPERGYRCSICGEREWLTDDEDMLSMPPGKRKKGETVWNRLSGRYGIKEGEHLCSWCAFKRLWPRIFLRWAKEQSDKIGQLNRYIVSTHAMALSTSMWNAIGQDGCFKEAIESIEALIKKFEIKDSAALPAKLYKRIVKDEVDIARRLPVLLDEVGDEDSEFEQHQIESAVKQFLGSAAERYYGFILMDGDRMGKWLAADSSLVPSLGDRFHPAVRQELAEKGLDGYLEALRPASPAWHQSISAALNNFSVGLARLVVEEMFMGKLIYAGGDDLLAMVAVHDLPGLMLALRCAYSGHMPQFVSKDIPKDGTAASMQAWQWLTGGAMPQGIQIRLEKGFALIRRGKDKRLLRLMGSKATASMGAVIAHHKTPLSRVLYELRAAEKRAKSTGGRDAFSLVLMKRAGGQSCFTGKWRLDSGLAGGDMGLLLRMRNFLANEDVSRRAAYLLSEEVRDVPPLAESLSTVLRFRFLRQGGSVVKQPEVALEVEALANSLAERAVSVDGGIIDENAKIAGYQVPGAWLRNLFITAEFLAREGRTPLTGSARIGGEE